MDIGFAWPASLEIAQGGNAAVADPEQHLLGNHGLASIQDAHAFVGPEKHILMVTLEKDARMLLLESHQVVEHGPRILAPVYIVAQEQQRVVRLGSDAGQEAPERTDRPVNIAKDQ